MPDMGAVWNANVTSVLVLTACSLAVAGCAGISGSGSRGLPDHEVFGGGTSTPLTLDRVSGTDQAKIGLATARQAVEQPFAAPAFGGSLRQFGLARVTATGGLAVEGQDLPHYDQRLA